MSRAETTRDPRSGRLRPARSSRILGALAVGAVFIGVLVAIDTWLPALYPTSLPDRAQDGLTLSLSVLIEAMPFIMLGLLLSVLVQVWLPPGLIERWMPRRGWARRAVLALLGMFLPVCECGNVPLARGLMIRGFSVPETMTFLIAAPIVNPVVILTTHQAFGWDGGILVARLVGGYLIANLIGFLYSRHPEPDRLLTDRFRAMCESEQHAHGSRMRRSLELFVTELRAVMPALVIGSGIAGAVQVLVPRETLLTIGANPVYSILAMIALGLLVAICSNVDAFFALSFASAFTPGSLVAFLLVGPVVDVKMIALMRTTYSTRALVGIVAVVIASAFVIAVGVNLFA